MSDVKTELTELEAAYDAEKAGLEQTITQLKTDLAAAKQGDLGALAALQGQVDELTVQLSTLQRWYDGANERIRKRDALILELQATLTKK